MGADWIIEKAWEPQYGARPLRRYVDKVIGTQLSRTIVSGQLTPHSDVAIEVDPSGQKLQYRISQAAGVDPATTPPQAKTSTEL